MQAMYNIHICGRIVKSCNSTSYCITKCKNISNYCLEYNNKEFNQFISQYPKKMKLQIFTRKKFVLKKGNKNIINKNMEYTPIIPIIPIIIPTFPGSRCYETV